MDLGQISFHTFFGGAGDGGGGGGGGGGYQNDNIITMGRKGQKITVYRFIWQCSIHL